VLLLLCWSALGFRGEPGKLLRVSVSSCTSAERMGCLGYVGVKGTSWSRGSRPNCLETLTLIQYPCIWRESAC